MIVIKKSSYLSLLRALLALVCASLCQAAAAQSFPSQPLRVVVPYPPGGTTDIIARQYSEYLAKELGQAVIIENRPGGSTNIAAEAVVKSKADGLTLFFSGINQTINPALGPFPSFELLSALAPVSLVARVPFILAANPKVLFAQPQELVQQAKAAPGKLSVSSAQLDVYVELLKIRADIDLLHVPYKGGAPATTDAIAGQVDMVFAQVPVLLPHIQSGRLKAIAVTAVSRLAALPNTATFVEAGIQFDLSGWYGILVPAATPTSIVEQLARSTQLIVATPEFSTKLRASGALAEANSPDQFKKQIEHELIFWKQLAQKLPKLARETK